MILTEQEVKDRMESPINLLNRLRDITNNHTNGSKSSIVSIPPTADKLITDIDDKLANGSLKSKAAVIMSEAMHELRSRLPEVQRPEKLAAIAAEMNKIVTAKNESDDDKHEKATFHVFAPQFVSENHYETIHVRE